MEAPAIAAEAIDPIAGARNFLDACLGVRAGDGVLLVVEPPDTRHYDRAVAALLAEQARARGADVAIVAVDPFSDLAALPPDLLAAVVRADHTIFLNRLGDRVRFGGLAGGGTKTMVYTLDLDYLGSEFARTSYALLQEVRQRLIARIASARTYSLRCSRGTDLEMRLDSANGGGAPVMADFALQNFPVMIFPPMPTSGLSGRLVLTGALVSTNTGVYADRVVSLNSPVTLTIERGRIGALDGDAALVGRVRRQFERVGALGAGDPWSMNSWHTGINLHTYFRGRADADWERWDGVAFGSPRYTHFHMCGADPGNICGQLFDATVSFDGEALWRNGDFCFLERPEIRALLVQHRAEPRMFKTRRDIGIEAR